MQIGFRSWQSRTFVLNSEKDIDCQRRAKRATMALHTRSQSTRQARISCPNKNWCDWRQISTMHRHEDSGAISARQNGSACRRRLRGWNNGLLRFAAVAAGTRVHLNIVIPSVARNDPGWFICKNALANSGKPQPYIITSLGLGWIALAVQLFCWRQEIEITVYPGSIDYCVLNQSTWAERNL